MTRMAVLEHWHPVLLGRDLADAPVGVKLAGTDIVLFRTGDGSAAALQDVCPHRGMRLSKGHVEDDRIVCPYHGWRYDRDGVGSCPSQPKRRATARRFDVVDRHGAVWVKEAGLVFTSGHLPRRTDGSLVTGKLGGGVTNEEGYEGARLAALGLLGTLKATLGDLDRVRRVVKLLAMVNCVPDFSQQPAVANGASDLLVEVFGDKGRHARSAVGMASLPLDACVEIDLVVQVSS